MTVDMVNPDINWHRGPELSAHERLCLTRRVAALDAEGLRFAVLMPKSRTSFYEFCKTSSGSWILVRKISSVHGEGLALRGTIEMTILLDASPSDNGGGPSTSYRMQHLFEGIMDQPVSDVICTALLLDQGCLEHQAYVGILPKLPGDAQIKVISCSANLKGKGRPLQELYQACLAMLRYPG